MRTPDYERKARDAVERLDILEDLMPRAICQVSDCDRQARYAWAGAFGQRWLCSRHRPLYRTHDRIIAQIRKL